MSTIVNSQIKSIVVGVALLSIITLSSFLILFNSDFFDFGEESGIFAIISSPDTAEIGMYYEGEPITLKADCFEIKRGEIELQSSFNSDFEENLIFSWSFRQISWEEDNWVKLKEDVALSEITFSSFRTGKYIFKVNVKGLSRDYKILNPMDYLTVSNEFLLRNGFDTFNFEISPLVESKTWITSPKSLSEFTVGEGITFKSISKRKFNLTKYYDLTNKQVEAVNEAKNFLECDYIKALIHNNLPSGVSVDDIVDDNDFMAPYGEELILSAYTTHYWYDEWTDSEGIHYPKTFLGQGSIINTSSLEAGYHTITFTVRDEEIESSASDKINLWISLEEQPSVPLMIEFLDSIEVDNTVFVDWDSSKSLNKNGYIDHYELQISNNQNDFHFGFEEPYIEGTDYVFILGDKTYYVFENLPSSVNSLINEDGKHWFRVRAVDNYGLTSFWSNIEGVMVDKAPSNIYSEGIFYDNGSRVDKHNPDYQSNKGFARVLTKSYLNEAMVNYSILSQPDSVYDFYEGQFEDDEVNYYYSNLNLTSDIIYQYQDFNLRLNTKDSELDIDPESSNQELQILIYSSLNGLIYQGEGYIDSKINISYHNDIVPYLNAKNQVKYSPLLRGNHTITVVVVDPSFIGYQLVSLVLEVKEIAPYWEADSLINVGRLFLDPTNDGKSDWGIFGLNWLYPKFNPYMPSYFETEETDWERNFEKILFFEIEITKQYGQNEYIDYIVQESAQNWHYWEDYDGIFEDFISPYELTTGNWSFRIKVVDRDYWTSEWSDPCKMFDNEGNPLVDTYDTKYPILLNEDNPPPNPVITSNGYLVDNKEYDIRVNEDLELEAINSTDLNGDALYYTWFLDGELRNDIVGFDPHAESVTIYPEWLGTDNNPSKNETTLLDGDDYGDWGLHNITLMVNDGVTIVNTSFKLNILPVNEQPTISRIIIEGVHKSDLNEDYLFDYESIRIYPEQITHFDNQNEIQDIEVNIEAIDKITNATAYTIFVTIESQVFSDFNSTITQEKLREIFNIDFVLPIGDYIINLAVSDGITSNTCSTELKIVEEIAPYSLTIVPYDKAGNILPQNETGYYIFPNQEITFELSWEDDQEDSEIKLELIDNFEGLIYDGIARREVNTQINKFYFGISGIHYVTAILKDPYGGISSTNITCFVLLVMILPTENMNTVESSIEIDVNHPDYWDQERSIADVPELLYCIGDGKTSSPSSYEILDHVYLDPIIYPNAQWLRVWFQMQTRIDSSDILIFKDVNDNICWKIRLTGDYTKSPNEAIYEYQDDEGNWHILPKLYLTDSYEYVESTDTVFCKSYENRLISVIIPGDTVKIEWVTTVSQGWLSDTLLSFNIMYGYKIAYVEYIGTKIPELVAPIDIDVKAIENSISNCPSILQKFVQNSWRKLVEDFDLSQKALSDKDMSFIISSEFSFKLSSIFKFVIKFSFNRFIGEFKIDATLSASTKPIPLIVGDLTLKAKGMIRLVILIGEDFAFVKDGLISIDFSATFGYDLLDLLYPLFPPITEPLNRLKTVFERFDITLFPNFLELTIGIQFRGGFHAFDGWWFRVGVFGEIALKWNIIKISEDDIPIFKISFRLMIYWKWTQYGGWVNGAYAKLTIAFKLSLGSLLGKDFKFDIVFLEFKFVKKWQFEEIPLEGGY